MIQADAFSLLGDPTRRRILDLLLAGPMHVGELVERVGASQPNVSKHLRVLKDGGLVRVRPEAQRRRYEIAPAPLAEVDAWIEPFRRLWAGQLDRLEAHLVEVED